MALTTVIIKGSKNVFMVILQAPKHPLITSEEMLRDFVKDPQPAML